MATVGLGLVVFATSAYAYGGVSANEGAYGTSFVDGADYAPDDFGDHRAELGNSLCYGCADSWNTDLVIMWQAILYAEGFLPAWEIDGEFGPKTRDATKKWQGRYDLTADGIVGNATWTMADSRLRADYETSVFHYWAMDNIGQVDFFRGSEAGGNGAYEMTGAYYGRASVRFYSSNHRIDFFKERIAVRY